MSWEAVARSAGDAARPPSVEQLVQVRRMTFGSASLSGVAVVGRPSAGTGSSATPLRFSGTLLNTTRRMRPESGFGGLSHYTVHVLNGSAVHCADPGRRRPQSGGTLVSVTRDLKDGLALCRSGSNCDAKRAVQLSSWPVRLSLQPIIRLAGSPLAGRTVVRCAPSLDSLSKLCEVTVSAL